MKKVLFVLFVVAGLTNAPAHGTFQFAANLTLAEPLPPFPFPYTGQGAFTLDGNTFRYSVQVPVYAPWTSQIRGPGVDGPVLFDLTLVYREPPLGSDPGSAGFAGRVELPEPWIADLKANRSYVTAMYPDVSADVHLQGQIVLVPEPSTLTFIGIAGGLMALRALFAFGGRHDWPCLRR